MNSEIYRETDFISYYQIASIQECEEMKEQEKKLVLFFNSKVSKLFIFLVFFSLNLSTVNATSNSNEISESFHKIGLKLAYNEDLKKVVKSSYGLSSGLSLSFLLIGAPTAESSAALLSYQSTGIFASVRLLQQSIFYAYENRLLVPVPQINKFMSLAFNPNLLKSLIAFYST